MAEIAAATGLSTTALVVVGASLAATAASTGLSVYMAKRQADEQSKLAGAIQSQKEAEATNARESAIFEEGQARRRTAFLIGKQEAIYGASGVDPSRGSPLIESIDLATQSELEALNVRRVGAIAAGESTFESRISRFRGESARGTIPYSIAGGVLEGTSKSANTVTTAWYGSRRGRY